MSKNLFNSILIFSFGIFGSTALIYQVVFAKNLVLLFGLTAPAIATILAVYFSGLALGSLIFGKLADYLKQNSRRYLLYVALFAGVGIYGFFVPDFFQILGKIIQWINQIYPLDFSRFNFFAFLLSFLFLIVPAILIGGGFPVVSKIFVRESETLGKKVSLLYFVNTFGSVFGALSTGFWLIPAIGGKMTIFSASGLNLLTAVFLALLMKIYRGQISLFSSTKESQHESKDNFNSPPKNLWRSDLHNIFERELFFYVLFLTGFLALALEVFYTKTLILFLGSSTFAFSLILIVFLLGITFGSLILAPLLDRLKRGPFFFGIFCGLLGFWCLLTLFLFEKLPFLYLKILEGFWQDPQFFDKPNFDSIIYSQSSILFFIIFPATFLMGMIFPLGIKLANPDLGKIGEGIGKLYFANTLGGVFGSLAAGFYLLPKFGFQKSLIFILTSYILLGVFFIGKEREIQKFIKVSILSFFFILVIFSIFSSPWSREILAIGSFPYAPGYLGLTEEKIKEILKKEEILFYKEGFSQVMVIKKGQLLSLKINGKIDASNGADMETEILTGALPLILHPNPKSVLVIGLGSGITLGAATQFDSLENIEAVEIDPAVVTAAQYFKKDNHDALTDPRVKMILADARNYLYLTDKKYDVISSGPSNPWVSGNAYLFTKEYYQLAKAHLKEKGIMAQWIQYYSFWSKDLKTVFRTFQEVFPKTYLFGSILTPDLLLIGGNTEDSLLSFYEIEKKFENEKIRTEFTRIYINNSYELLSRFIGAPEAISRITEGIKTHTDDKPFLEFSAPQAIYQKTMVPNLEILANLYTKRGYPRFFIGAEEKEVLRHSDFFQNWLQAQIAFYSQDYEKAIYFYEQALKFVYHPEVQRSLNNLLRH